MSKRTKYQARRPMPRIRTRARAHVEKTTLTLGDVIAAAYDSLGDTRSVVRLLTSNAMADRIGIQLIVD